MVAVRTQQRPVGVDLSVNVSVRSSVGQIVVGANMAHTYLL